MNDSYKIYASRDYVNEVAGGAVKSVPQELTDEEKAQARANIAAVNSWDELEDKPFGEDISLITVMEETTHDFSSSLNMGFSPVVGTTYQVVVDGTNYYVTAYREEIIPGEIYIPAFKSDDGVFSAEGQTLTFADGETHTVAIYQNANVIKTLDEKFIPDSIVRTGEAVLSVNGYAPSLDGNVDVLWESIAGVPCVQQGKVRTAVALNTHDNYMTSNNDASGNYSVAEGYLTTASGPYSHAEGSGTVASGDNSHAEGDGTVAATFSQHVQGTYNILDSSDHHLRNGQYAHIVGNGSDDTRRSNAHTLDWDGNAWFQGTVKIGGTGFYDETAKELATKEYVNTTISAVVDSAPETLNTLNELAAALGDDENFAATIAGQIGALESKVGDTSVSEQINTAIDERTYTAADVGAIPNETGVITKDHLPDLIINNAKLDYNSVSNAKIIQGTIQADRLSADARAYLTGGPYLGISYDGSSRLDITQGKHLYAMRLKNDNAINLNTWLINHATYNGEYLFNGTDIEGPMKLTGRSDFIGGIHGDEVMTDVRFIVDGVDITNGGAVELNDAHVLTAYITSTIYDVDSTNALFTRNKTLTFAENKLIVENKWTYIGGEGNIIERWPACGLYPVYKDMMLGYTIDNKFYTADEAATTTPNMYLRNITFWAGGTNINIKALDGCAGQQYRGWVQHFGDEERPRVKVYFDTFSSEASAYTLVNGDILEASFCVTVGGIKEHDEPSRPSTYVDVREGTDNIIPLHPVGVTHNATGVKESLISYTGVQYQVTSGDESTEGRAQLVLGNNIPAGTAGNKTGRLSLYSANGVTSGTLIQENSTSPYVTNILPANGGVLLSEGNYSNYALPKTGGTVTGDITLNGGSSGLNYKTQRIINDSAYESRQALTYDAAAVFQLAKDNTVVNGMSVYEDQTKFSKPINVTGGSAGDNAAQTRTNLGAASQSDLNALKTLVGNTAVADQIQTAIANITLETLGLKTETWTLTMADGTTVTKNVVVV